MAGLFYSVDLTRDERMARNPRLVEKFLVELCQEPKRKPRSFAPPCIAKPNRAKAAWVLYLPMTLKKGESLNSLLG
jgi:hypothetical protein